VCAWGSMIWRPMSEETKYRQRAHLATLRASRRFEERFNVSLGFDPEGDYRPIFGIARLLQILVSEGDVDVPDDLFMDIALMLNQNEIFRHQLTFQAEQLKKLPLSSTGLVESNSSFANVGSSTPCSSVGLRRK
jgi:hypothetical protein